MSLRKLVQALTLLMAGLALFSTAVLAIATTFANRATSRLADATGGLRSAEEIESDLLLHNLQAYLWLATGDPIHRQQRDLAVARLEAHLAESRRLAVDDEELAVVAEVERAVEAHLESWDQIRESGVPALDGFERAAVSLGPASTVADRLTALNIEQAERAVEDSRRLDRLTNVAAVALALALLALAGAGSVLIRRRLYVPFLSLREAMHRYAAGERQARASTRGPEEIADVARDFNEVAESLERERVDRLAFVGAVAHDLKNPLAALKVAVLRPARPGDPEAQERRTALARRQIERMERMLGDFLELSRLEAGRLELRVEEVDVAGVARDVAELFEGTSPRHRLEVSTPPEPVRARADRQRLEQILDNLVSNAIKYSPEGGPVELRVRRADGTAVVEVVDRGIGVAPADRERIFEPFRRLDAGAATPGMGLGLAVTRRLVERQGGHIAVESEPGRGSTFRVELPVAAPA